jgi:nucleotide-binding universal stress UspA family protein
VKEDVAALQHILVATDFGSSSVRAVHLAAELAARFESRLTVLHVVLDPMPVYAVEMPVPVALGTREERKLGARRELDGFLTALPERISRCEGVIRFGEPAHEIVAHGEETACNLIVMGTHGRRRLSRLLLGSVAEKVVRTSRVPVLTVRGEEAA